MSIARTEGDVRLWRAPELDGLELVHARYVRCDFPQHVHDEVVIAVMLAGAEELSVGGRPYTVRCGAVIRLNPGEPHRNRSIGEEGAAYRTFYPAPELFGRLAEAAVGRADAVFETPVVEHAAASAALLRLHQGLERRGSRLQAESAFAAALAPLLDDGAPRPSARRGERGPVRRAREHLDARYDHNTSLAELARVSGLSAYHLLRCFRDEVGLPPAQYQTHVRVRHAKALLREGRALADVAVSVGFVDQSHLSRCFKRIVGVTPGAYARSNTVQDGRLEAGHA